MVTVTHAVETVAAASSPLLGVYRPSGPVFVGGEGSFLVSADGARYLDFTSGIAVNALGYGDAGLSGAIRSALDTGVIHTSNLFRTRPATDLAQWLVDHSFADRVFFCNSGAEANEAALKFARRWARAQGGDEKTEIVAFRGGFHGRTLGALSVTDRPSYREPFQPLLPGVRFGETEDSAGLAALVCPRRTAAVIIEPIQGEGGVLPVSGEFLRAVREACDAANALLIFDEVQVGLGRTGTLWAHEACGVEPDLLTVAKPLAGGLPMGGVLLRERVAETIVPGDHATTFGGGPLVAAAALEVCSRVGDPSFLADVAARGAWMGEQLRSLAARHEKVTAVRGAGLIWGVELTEPASEVVSRALAARLLLCSAGANVVRLVPPLTVGYDEMARGLAILEESL